MDPSQRGGALSVISAIDPNSAITDAEIRAALQTQQVVARDSLFPGRLSTEVYADDRVVIKLRHDLAFPPTDVVRWIDGRIGREREAGVYPNDRTWILVAQGEELTVGTASRRRRPLHLWDTEELSRRWEWYCTQFCALYLQGAMHNWRLDEGPSNFAPDVEPGGRLVYLDDDLYPWDRGTALSSSWRILSSRQPQLTQEQGELLGSAMRAEMARHNAVLDAAQVAADLRRGPSVSPFLQGLHVALTAPRRQKATEAPSAPDRRARWVALISDIHGNSVALDAVLAEPAVQEAGTLLVLGDTIGYGPDPLGCIARVRDDPRVQVLRGNHDHAGVDAQQVNRFTKEARWVMEWTRERLAPGDQDWLEQLPLDLNGPDWYAVHGAPIDPTRFNAYIYQMTAEDNLAQIELDGIPLCFYGNTHVQGAWVRTHKRGPAKFLPPTQTLDLADYSNVLVCPGSVGQPRDEDPRAAYVIYDREDKRIHYARVAYDIAAVQRQMTELGFPERLQARLETGR